MSIQSIINKIIKNWPAKVLSMAIAIFLVVFHRLNMVEERFFSSPLTIIQNGNMLPATQWPATVRISIRGNAESIYPILESDVTAFLDLTKYNVKGIYRVPVEVQKRGTALNNETIQIRIEPPEVQLELDVKTSKYVKLSASITGYVPEGYTLASQIFKPAEVLVDGPASILDKLSTIFSKEIDINGRTDEFTQSVGINSVNPLLNIHGDGVFEFTGIIRANLLTRFYERTISLVGANTNYEYIINPRLANFYLQGREDRINAYEPPLDALYIDVSKLNTPGIYSIKVEAVGRDDFYLVSIEPSEVNLQIIDME